jgi:hypothetical protein
MNIDSLQPKVTELHSDSATQYVVSSCDKDGADFVHNVSRGS